MNTMQAADCGSQVMRAPRVFTLAGLLLLAACGGGGDDVYTSGGGGGGGSGGGSSGGVTLPASSTVAQVCVAPRAPGTLDPDGQPYGDRQGTAADEKSWVRSWIDETYLWYQDVRSLSATTLDASRYADAPTYFDALKASDAKDHFHFYYDTPTWVALSQSGVSYGYGFTVELLAAAPPRRAVIAYADPGSQAATKGLARGDEILTVDGVDLVNDGSQAGVDTLNAGLYPDAAGSHVLTYRSLNGVVHSVTLVAAATTEISVSNVTTLPAPNNTVGYMLFNDHIAPSEQLLVDGITQLKAAGVTDLVLDLRYNGGGYLDIAAELAYMIAGPTTTGGKVFEKLTFNDKNPFGLTDAQRTTPFHDTTQGFSTTANQALPYLGLNRVFVLVGNGTCSASEAIVNGLRGVGVTVNLIGDTTCGKPYGFYPQDNCNTTYFSIQFKGVNQLGFGDYTDGFAPTCAIDDDFAHALGDPAEGRLAGALYLRTNGSCQVGAASASKSAALAAHRSLGAAAAALHRSPLRENRFYRGARSGT